MSKFPLHLLVAELGPSFGKKSWNWPYRTWQVRFASQAGWNSYMSPRSSQSSRPYCKGNSIGIQMIHWGFLQSFCTMHLNNVFFFFFPKLCFYLTTTISFKTTKNVKSCWIFPKAHTLLLSGMKTSGLTQLREVFLHPPCITELNFIR